MDRQTFFDLLSEKLLVRGVSQEHIDRQIRQFEKYFSTMTEAEVSAQIDSLNNMEELADNICEILHKKDGEPSESGKTENAPSGQEPDAGEEENASEKPSASMPEEEPAAAQKKEKAELISDLEDLFAPGAGRPQRQQEENPVSAPHDHPASPKADAAGGRRHPNVILEEADVQIDDAQTINLDRIRPDQIRHRPSSSKEKQRENWDDEENQFGDEVSQALSFSDLSTGASQNQKRDRAIFWGVVILTLPLTLFLFGAMVLLFLAVFFALASVIVGGIAVLVVVAAAGTGVSLFGIIYGVTQCLSSLPIGLYELGIGITVGGLALMVGILLYNFVIRFIPFVISKWFVLFKYTLRKLKELFLFIKKESIGA